MIDRKLIDQVRERTDIAGLIEQYVPLRREGSRFIARCPFHEEKTPSFSVSPDKGLYFCFGCKATGDAIGFYQQLEGCTFPEALRALAERAGVEVPETREPERIAEDRRQRDVSERLHAVCELAAAFFERCLEEGPSSELARGALEERGVSAEVAKQFRLGCAPAQWDALAQHLRAKKVSPADAELAGLLMPGRGSSYDRFRHRLMFPVFDRGGRVVAFSGRILPISEEIPEGIVPEETGKYINSPETPIYRKGELLYGLANARLAMRQKAEAIVVEGNFDVVQMHQHGFHETVALLGTSFTDAQARLLRRFAATAVLVFDGDEAGRKAARAAHAVCAGVGLIAKVGLLPPKTDPDSYLRSTNHDQGRAGMEKVIAAGPSIVEWLIQDEATRCGLSVPERVAALRLLAPAIRAVQDPIERHVYRRLAGSKLRMDDSDVLAAINAASDAVMPSPSGILQSKGAFRDARAGEIATAAATARPQEGWEQSLPLGELYGPPFPLDLYSAGWLHDYVAAVALSTQTPVDLSAMLGLAVLSAVVGGCCEAYPTSEWRELAVLFVAVAIPPAGRKSAVYHAMTWPLAEFEKRVNALRATDVESSASRLRVAEQRCRMAEEALAKSPETAALKDRLAAAVRERHAARHALVRPLRLTADDATPEALTTLLQENGGRLAVFSPEGGGLLDMMAGGYADNPKIEIYLKGHVGEDHRVDRRGRSPEYVHRPRLTIGVTVQPDALRAMDRRSELRGRGLLGRFLYAVPRSNLGHRITRPPPVP